MYLMYMFLLHTYTYSYSLFRHHCGIILRLYTVVNESDGYTILGFFVPFKFTNINIPIMS